MKKIKVKFTDLWKNFYRDTIFLDILKNHYIVEISDDPDFLFYCNRLPDYMQFEDRYLRYSHFYKYLPKIEGSRKIISNNLVNRKFCNFVYSNEFSKGTEIRKNFCQKLMDYKHIDCPGTVLHNIDPECFVKGDNQDWFNAKVQFVKDYKFTIAFENFSCNGYTTEKIIQPLMVNSIPIYWGNSKINRMFNPNAIINCHDYKSFDEVIDYVKYLDTHDDEYLKILKEPIFITPEHKIDYDLELEKFLINIVEKHTGGGIPKFNKDILCASSFSKLSKFYLSTTKNLNKKSFIKKILDRCKYVNQFFKLKRKK